LPCFQRKQHRGGLFAWLISHQPAVLFSHIKPATSNQPAVLFSQNKPAPAISHQPTEQADCLPYMIAATGIGGRVDKVSVKKNRRHRQKQFLASVFFVKTRFRRSNKGGPRWQVGPL
jgi:hypothetical protein